MGVKRKPNGFYARCQCGTIIESIENNGEFRSSVASTLYRWLQDGCQVVPLFDKVKVVSLGRCTCDKEPES